MPETVVSFAFGDSVYKLLFYTYDLTRQQIISFQSRTVVSARRTMFTPVQTC
jgi:hypothetical protein